MAQQVRIDIEMEYEAEAAAAEAEFVLELVDLLPDVNRTIMELTADEEDTDELIDSTVPEYWENLNLEAK